MKKMLKIPKLKNEKQERAFFDKVDFSFPNLKPSSHPVLIKTYLADKLSLKNLT